MSGGWFKVDAASWPAIAEVMPEVWPEEAAVVDLRWYDDQVRLGRRRRVPGRPALMKRWGWKDHEVRTLLKAEERWKLTQVSPVSRQPSASDPPAIRQATEGESPKIEKNPPAIRQRSASGAPENLHARKETEAEDREQNVLSHSSGEVRGHQGATVKGAPRIPGQSEGAAPGSTPTAVDQVVELWLQLQQGMHHPEPTEVERLQLEALIGDLGVEAVIDVVRWWWSGHSHATWLRAQGYGWSTWLKPELARRYLKMARAPAAPTRAKRRHRPAQRRRVERLPERAEPPSGEQAEAAEAATAQAVQELMQALTECEDPDTAVMWADIVAKAVDLAELDLDTLELAVPLWRMMAEEMGALDWPEPRIRRVNEQGDAWEKALQEARRRRLRVVQGGGK